MGGTIGIGTSPLRLSLSITSATSVEDATLATALRGFALEVDRMSVEATPAFAAIPSLGKVGPNLVVEIRLLLAEPDRCHRTLRRVLRMASALAFDTFGEYNATLGSSEVTVRTRRESQRAAAHLLRLALIPARLPSPPDPTPHFLRHLVEKTMGLRPFGVIRQLRGDHAVTYGLLTDGGLVLCSHLRGGWLVSCVERQRLWCSVVDSKALWLALWLEHALDAAPIELLYTLTEDAGAVRRTRFDAPRGPIVVREKDQAGLVVELVYEQRCLLHVRDATQQSGQLVTVECVPF
jgi:hypothetical protein